MTIPNLTDEYRVMPYLDSHHKKKPETYVFIRIVSRKNVNDTKDIPIYNESGIRLKVKPESFEKGTIKKGYYSDSETTSLNDLILKIWQKTIDYVKSHPLSTRQLIEENLYGKEFISKHKQARTREIHVELKERTYTDYYHQLRKKFPKRRTTIYSTSIDEDGFEVKESKEIIIDPLDLSPSNFPHNFPDELFKKYSKEFPSKKADKFILTQFVRFRASTDLYSSKTKEVVKIDNEVLKEFKTQSKKNTPRTYDYAVEVDGKSELVSDKNQLLQIRRQKEIEKLTSIERYEKGVFDKENIFHVCGQILFLYKNPKAKKEYTKNWKMAVMKLFDYRSRANPLEHTNDLSVEWIDELITYIKEHGYSKAHPKHFDPFNYDPEVFVRGNTGRYNDLSLQKFIKNVKEVFRHLISENQLPMVNIDKIRYEDYNLSNVKQDTEEQFYLTKPELDKLFHFNSFKDVLANKRLIYSKEILAKARDLFILQFWFGGLRPREELLLDNGITILDDGYGGKKVHYFISKDSNTTNENPICTYSELILEKYNYDFESIKIDYTNYSKILKEIGKQVFNRKIIKYVQFNGKLEKQETNVNVEFTSYFARRTFEQILNFAGVNQADTAAFTGRKLNLGSIKNYRSLTYDQKREIMEKIKPIN